MEIRLSLALLVVLGGIALSLAASTPVPAVPTAGETGRELAALEDAFALHRDDLALARRLTAEYLRLGQPAFAMGVVRAASPTLITDPLLTHRLAQAYEAVGRLDDALATAQVAYARCLRAVGSAELAYGAEPADLKCTPAELVALDQHEQSLIQMLRWGVTDPVHDPRAKLARGLSERRARIASITP